jgi:chromosome segregation ATPase
MMVRNEYAAIMMVARWLQKMQRGRKGRAKYNELNQIRKATKLQTYWRQKSANKAFTEKKNGALVVQCAFRSLKARRELKALRVASRDLSATKKQSESLKSEMQTLKAELKKAKAFAEAESKRAAGAEAAGLASSSNVSSTELDELKSELASVSTQLEASRIRAKEESVRADAAEESAQDLMQQVKEAHRASMKMKKELKAALIGSSVEKSHDPIRKDFDNEKFLAMKEELDEANRKLAATKTEGQVALTSTIHHVDQSEIDQLQQELLSAKEAAEMASNEIDELTNINEQLQVELEAAMEGMPEAPMMAGGPDFASPLPSKELMAARKEIKSLKAELADQRNQLRASETVGQGEAAAEEILTLQDEVDRLNGELIKARSSGAPSMDKDRNILTPPSTAHDAELRKLSDAVKKKDYKIDELRTELKIIKEELERADAMTNGDGAAKNGEIRQTIENPLALDDSHGASIGHVASLRIENEKIRKKARAVGLECSELKLQLRKQTVQTIRELSNLAKALEEVDQLRRKSESRTRVKKPLMNKNVQFMDEERARSSRNLNGRQQPASTLFEDGLWRRVRAGVIMATVGESNVNEDVGHGGASASRRQLRRGSSARRRNKNSDDSSVTSAYF